MIGAIAGDIIGSRFEWDNIKSKNFELFTGGSVFTDDTVLTVAIADALMSGGDYAAFLRRYASAYRGCEYGDRFYNWTKARNPGPYGSYGNGSAMRVSSVGWAFDDVERVIVEARKTAEVTHNHPEGMKGAEATASLIFLARTGSNKEKLRSFIESRFGYDLNRTVDSIREVYEFDETCQGTVPEAIICFLGSTSFEDAIRNAISIGGDSDTVACITGGIAEAFYGGVPTPIAEQVLARLTTDLAQVVHVFETRFKSRILSAQV